MKRKPKRERAEILAALRAALGSPTAAAGTAEHALVQSISADAAVATVAAERPLEAADRVRRDLASLPDDQREGIIALFVRPRRPPGRPKKWTHERLLGALADDN